MSQKTLLLRVHFLKVSILLSLQRKKNDGWRWTVLNSFLLGASVRHSARGKGHEEGGSTYAKVGLSLRSPLETLEHLPP